MDQYLSDDELTMLWVSPVAGYVFEYGRNTVDDGWLLMRICHLVPNPNAA